MIYLLCHLSDLHPLQPLGSSTSELGSSSIVGRDDMRRGLNRVLNNNFEPENFSKQLSQVPDLEYGSNVVRNNRCIFCARMNLNDLKASQIRG